MTRPSLDEQQIAELEAAIRADPTPHIRTRQPGHKLTQNRQSRNRLRGLGGMSTTINLTPEARDAIFILRQMFNEVNTQSDAVNLAVRWLVDFVNSSNIQTLHVGGAPGKASQ